MVVEVGPDEVGTYVATVPSLVDCRPAATVWDRARSVSAEMHSGFAALRQHWPMKAVGTAQVELPPAGKDDVARVQQLWEQCRSQFSSRGPWLFGEYSIADAMYAPVALRFRHYGATFANASAEAYYQQLMQDEHLRRWIEDAAAEVADNFGAGR